MKTALLVIDVQNEYFAGGKFPQENADETAQKIAAEIRSAQTDGRLVIGIRHVSPEGKAHADCFLETDLAEILTRHGIEALDICGMMTQNCVTHTALSPAAAAYRVRVLGGLCAAPSVLIHQIALRALADRTAVV